MVLFFLNLCANLVSLKKHNFVTKLPLDQIFLNTAVYNISKLSKFRFESACQSEKSNKYTHIDFIYFVLINCIIILFVFIYSFFVIQ